MTTTPNASAHGASSADEERAIPLTPPGPNWSQREYVACTKVGIGFAAHGSHSGLHSVWHYGFPGDIGCTSVLIKDGRAIAYFDHNFVRTAGWIDRARRDTYDWRT